ncbi:MAG: hypothetical protein PHR07_04530, partial [Acidaminococcaceae bacterium]|nr:hypothetical protein [Acidaminococcaceae bacterium]
KIVDLTTSSVTMGAGSTSGGALTNIAYWGIVVPGNAWGPSKAVTAETYTPSGATYVKLSWSAVTGATWYDLFLSADSGAPKWVARCTALQHTTGGYRVASVGAVTSGGSNGANTIDIGVVGTGQASTATCFTFNNAYLPNAASITAINCSGKKKAYVLVKIGVDDLRSAPTASIIPFYQSHNSSGDYFQGTKVDLNLLTATGKSFEQLIILDVDALGGVTNETAVEGLAILVDTLTGQGATCDVYVELAS